MPSIVWAGGVSICPACNGRNFWVSQPPSWDTDFYESLARSIKKMDDEYDARIKVRINDPSRLP